MRVYRLNPLTGEKQFPIREDGYYLLADPKYGAHRHHAFAKVLVRTEEEMIALIRQGYPIRIRTGIASSLIRRDLYIDGK